MANELQTVVDGTTVERVLLDGDLGKLTASQRVAFYGKVCDSLGLNPLTRPFEYILLGRPPKLTLYARREATEQLRRLHKVSLTITAREVTEEAYVVTAKATMPDGRTDESVGVKSLANLKGDDRANAMMTAETKAKRRVTLSICGLGMLDETEVADIPPSVIGPSESYRTDAAPPPPSNEPPLPEGFVRVERVDVAPTKKEGVRKYHVTLSSGEVVTTISDWLGALAQSYAEQRTPVRATTEQNKWGTDLKKLQTVAQVETKPESLPLTADDIPF